MELTVRCCKDNNNFSIYNIQCKKLRITIVPFNDNLYQDSHCQVPYGDHQASLRLSK